MSILVRHAMTEAPRSIRSDMTAVDAAALMAQFDVGAIPVLDDGRLRGIVTDRDLATRVVAEGRDPRTVPVGEVMTRAVITVSLDAQLSEARDLMAERRIRRLPVVKGDQLVGIISLGDVALADASKRLVGEALEEISDSPSTRTLKDQPERGTPEGARGT
jgi:CBS domain-containing protein